jgi:hypothetical protein
MRRKPSQKTIRVKVRYSEGAWHRDEGGDVPVRDGAVAELIVRQRDIVDQDFLSSMLKEHSVRVLSEGQPLYAYVMVKDFDKIDPTLATYLIRPQKVSNMVAVEFLDNWSGGELCLVKVALGKLDPDAMINSDDDQGGGLWMRVRGRDVVGLVTSQIVLPDGVTKRRISSLNHAFTVLSEVFEPWRTSHTGNIYERFLYQEENGKLYPLELFRDEALAKQEQSIALELWKRFMLHAAAKKATP